MTSIKTRRGMFRAVAGAVLAPFALEGSAFASPRVSIARVHVDVSRLRGRRGDPTARWVADDMAPSVARALGPRLVRGAPGGAVLNVHVDDVSLPMLRSGGARIVDDISGFVALNGPGVSPRRSAIRTVAVFRSRPVDTPMWVEANRRRVATLVDRFAHQIPRDLGL